MAAAFIDECRALSQPLRLLDCLRIFTNVPFTVKLLLPYGSMFGKKHSFSVDDARVRDILERLSKMYGEEFVENVYDPKRGAVRGNIVILLNSRSIDHLQGLDTVIRDGDSLVVTTLLGGG